MEIVFLIYILIALLVRGFSVYSFINRHTIYSQKLLLNLYIYIFPIGIFFISLHPNTMIHENID